MSYFCLKTISFFIVTFFKALFVNLIYFTDLFPPGVHCGQQDIFGQQDIVTKTSLRKTNNNNNLLKCKTT